MTTSELYHRLRECYRDYFDKVNPEVDSESLDVLRGFADEYGYPIDDDFAKWVFASSDQPIPSNFSGLCHVFGALGEECCTDRPERYFIAYQDISYDSGEEYNPLTCVHCLLKVGDLYYDIFFPDGVEDCRLHPLFQEVEGENIFSVVDKEEMDIEFTDEFAPAIEVIREWIK